jgi:glycosyltransferase involved in cell wall biosynthesis
MKKEPEISVISACYNHGKFIQEMIESVFRQPFADYEIIIVNDGSTDDTANILNSIANEKVKIIHTENLGPAHARNTAIKHSRAPLILNVDADDKIAPGLLSKAFEIFSTNSNAGIVYCDAECFGARSGKFEIGEYTKEAMLHDNRITSLGFFRKNDWLTVGGYSDEFKYGLEDWDFWLSVIELGGEVIRIPEPLFYYRTYENLTESRSGRRKTNRLKTLESQVVLFRRHKRLYSEFPDALEFFLKIEKKFKNENFMIRFVKNNLYGLMRKYYWK